MMHSAYLQASKNGGATRKPLTVLAQTTVVSGCVLAMATVASAGPKGEKVVHGKASFERIGDLTRIKAGNNAIINFKSFDIHKHETVRFVQPSARSRVLNRITSGDPSRIAGTLKANGQVYITNPAGIYFAEGALVDVGKLFAAAGQITDSEFIRNVDHFTDLTGSVLNEGTIHADAVGLIGRHVANHGSIVAGEGFVAMVAGEDVLLGERGGQIVVKLEGADTSTIVEDTPGVENTGLVAAPSGTVLMGAGDIYALPIHHTGRSQGKQVLLDGGAGGVVDVSGTLDASNRNPGAEGGRVEVLGDKIALREVAIDASGDAGGGTVLIGGEYQGQGDVRTADKTYVSSNATIKADAITTGKGGRVILWADDWTNYYGNISARGGVDSGDGGFVEVSGKQNLGFDGHIDVKAVNGANGSILLDPESITIDDSGTLSDEALLSEGGIFLSERESENLDISKTALEALTGDITLEASRFILLRDLDGDLLDLSDISTLTIRAGLGLSHEEASSGRSPGFAADSPLDVIRTDGGNIVIEGYAIFLPSIDTSGGDLTLTATSEIHFSERIDLEGGTLNAISGGAIIPVGNITAGTVVMHARGIETPLIDIPPGRGDITFESVITYPDTSMVALPSEIHADVQIYRASDGVGGGESDAFISAYSDSRLTFRNSTDTGPPDEITFRQDATITEVPTASQFGGTGPAHLRLQSDDGGISLVGRVDDVPVDLPIDLPGSEITLVSNGSFAFGPVTADSLALELLTGFEEILLTRNVVTTGAPVTFTEFVTLAGEVVIDTTGAGAVPAGADVTVNGSIDGDIFAEGGGPQDLTINAGAGSVQIEGSVFGLEDLVITGGSIDVAAVSTTGSQTYNGPTVLRGDLLFRDGLTFDGPVVLNNNVLIDGRIGESISPLVFNSSVDAATPGGQGLHIDYLEGQVQFDGAVGAESRLSLLHVFLTSEIEIASVSTVGVQEYQGTAILEGNLITEGGDIVFRDSVDLAADVTIDATDVGGVPSGADVMINGTINAIEPGGQGLTIRAGEGAVIGLERVGARTPLASVDASGGSVTWTAGGLGLALETTGPQRHESTVGDVNLGGFSQASELEIVSAGNISIAGAITTGDQIFTSAGGEGTFRTSVGTFNSSDGDIIFDADLLLDDGIDVRIIDSTTTTNRIEITGDVTRRIPTVDPIVTLDAGLGSIRIGGDVSEISSLTAIGGGPNEFAGVSTFGIQLYSGPVVLGGDILSGSGSLTFSSFVQLLTDLTIDATNGGLATGAPIIFEGLIGGGPALTVVAGVGDVTFDIPISGVDRLSVSGERINVAGMSTFSSQSYEGPVSLTGDLITEGGSVSFLDTVELASDVTIDTTGLGSVPTGAAVTFDGPVDGGHVLFVRAGEGAVQGFAQVGAETSLSSVDILAGSVSWSPGSPAVPLFRTTGPQRFETTVGDVSLELFSQSSDLEIISADGIFVGGAGTVGNQMFTASGGAGEFRNTNGVFRSEGGDITFNANVSVTRQIQVRTNEAGATTGRIEISGGVTRRSDTIDPDVVLTAGDGGVHIGGDVSLIDEFTVTGGLIDLGVVETIGPQTYTGSATLRGNLTTEGAGITFNDPVALNFDVTIDTTSMDAAIDGADVTFNGTIDGGTNTLSITSGAGTVQVVDAIFNLDRLDVTGNVIELNEVNTTGDIRLASDFLFFTGGSDSISTSEGGQLEFVLITPAPLFAGSIDMDSVADGFFRIVIGEGSTSVIFEEGLFTTTDPLVVRGDTVPGSEGITINEALRGEDDASFTFEGSTVFNDDIITDSSPVAFFGPVEVGPTDVVLDTTDGGIGPGASVLFNEAVTATGEGVGLTIVAGSADVSFDEAITGLDRLTLTGGLIEVNNVSTTGDQSYTGIASLAGDLVTEGGGVTLNNAAELRGSISVDTTSGGLVAGGDVRFAGPVSSEIPGDATLIVDAGVASVQLESPVSGLESLTLIGGLIDLAGASTSGSQVYSGPTTLRGDLLTLDSGITFQEALMLGADVTIDTTGDGGSGSSALLTFNGPVNATSEGGQGLTIFVGEGLVEGFDQIGATNPLSSITINAGEISWVVEGGAMSLVSTTGPQRFETSSGAVSLGLFSQSSGVTIDSASDIFLDGAESAGAQSFVAAVGAGEFRTNAGVFSTEGGDITFDANVFAGSQLLVSTDGSDATTGRIEITGGLSNLLPTINPSVSLIAGDGGVQITGGVSSVDTLEITAGSIDIASVSTISLQEYTGDIILRGDLVAVGDSVTLNGPTVLATTVTVDTTSADTSPGGAPVAFNGTVDAAMHGVQGLVVVAGDGQVVLGGTISGLESLVVDGGPIHLLAGVSTVNNQSYTGMSTFEDDLVTSMLGGDLVTEGGSVTLNDNFVLSTDVIVDTTNAGSSPAGADVTFGGTVNAISSQRLTIDAGTAGNILLGEGDPRGGPTSILRSINIAGGSIETLNIETTESQIYESFAGDIFLNGQIVASDLTVMSAGDIDIFAVSTADSQTYTLADPLLNRIRPLGGAFGLIQTDGGQLIFNGSVSPASTGTLTMRTDGGGATTGRIEINGDVSFVGPAPLGSLAMVAGDGGVEIAGVVNTDQLDITGGSIDVSAVNTTNHQTYNGPTTLNGDLITESGEITFSDGVTLGTDVTIDTTNLGESSLGADVTFLGLVVGVEAEGGEAGLTVEAGTSGIRLVGPVSNVSHLTASGGSIELAATQVTNDIFLVGDGIVFTGGNDSISTLAEGELNLMTLSTTFTDIGVDFDALADGFSQIIVGDGTSSIMIERGFRVTDPLTVLGDLAAESEGIIITGAILAEDDASLTFEGATIIDANITTDSNTVTFTGPVQLDASDIVLDTTNSGISAGADVTFGSTINAAEPGSSGLTIEAGVGAVEGLDEVGADIPLASLSVIAGSIDWSAEGSATLLINTTGAQNYVSTSGDVRLDLHGQSSDLTITSAADIFVASATTTGNQTFTANGGAGRFHTNFGEFLSEGGDVTFNANVSVENQIQVLTNASEGMGGNINITGALTNDAPADNPDVILDAGEGNVFISGPITEINSLNIAGGSIVLPAVSTIGIQSYTGAVILEGDLITEGGEVEFSDSVTLAEDVFIDTTNFGAFESGAGVTFGGLIRGSIDDSSPSLPEQGLAIEAGSSSIRLAGPVSDLAFMELSGGLLELASVNTAGNIKLSSDSFIFTDGTDSIRTTDGGELELIVITPLSPGEDAGIDFDAFADGFSHITFGEGHSSIVIPDGFTVRDPMTIRGDTVVEGDGITVSGVFLGEDDASLTFEGLTSIEGVVLTDSNTVTFTGPVQLASSSVLIDTTNGGDGVGADVTFSGPVSAALPDEQGLVIDAGSGQVTASDSISNLKSLDITSRSVALAAVSTTEDIRLTSDNFNFIGESNSIRTTGGGILELNVITPSVLADETNIHFDALANGFTQIILGQGSSSITISDSFTVKDPLTLLANSVDIDGSITINAEIFGEGDGALTFEGSTSINENILLDSGEISFNGSVSAADGVTISGSAVTFRDVLSLNGNAIGRLNILGDFVLEASSTLELTLNSKEDHDQLTVSDGNIVLGGAQLDLDVGDGVKEGDGFVVIANEGDGAIPDKFEAGNEITADGLKFGIKYEGDITLGRKIPVGEPAGIDPIGSFDPDPQFDVERSVIKTETRTQFAETDLSSVQHEALAQLGIYARGMQTHERHDFLLTGRWLIVEIAPPDADATQYKVPEMRMNHELVVDSLDLAQDLFWEVALDAKTQEPIIDPDTNNYVLRKRSGDIRNVLSRAVRLYRSENDREFDSAELRQFLNTDPRASQARAYADQLEELIEHLDLFGLTGQELGGATGKLLKEVLPKRMTVLQLEEVIRQPEPFINGPSEHIPSDDPGSSARLQTDVNESM